MKTKKNSKTATEKEQEYKDRNQKTKVEDSTGKRPERDTNPLPPNPNQVDNHKE
ncbi:MAG: hypothetical protein LBE37_10385 [Sphingobacterium sp.]|jgi:hypothetical protein|nr:hypothetical protein [Sphingobacterium sp.]